MNAGHTNHSKCCLSEVQRHRFSSPHSRPITILTLQIFVDKTSVVLLQTFQHLSLLTSKSSALYRKDQTAHSTLIQDENYGCW